MPEIHQGAHRPPVAIVGAVILIIRCIVEGAVQEAAATIVFDDQGKFILWLRISIKILHTFIVSQISSTVRTFTQSPGAQSGGSRR